MPISAQDASITWGSLTLTEVTDYTVDANISYTRDPGDYGTVVIRSFTNAIPSYSFGKYKLLTITHSGVVRFKAGAVADRLRIEAVTNDVLRYVTSFRLVYPARNY